MHLVLDAIHEVRKDVQDVNGRLDRMDTERARARDERAVRDNEVLQRLTRVEDKLDFTNGKVTRHDGEIRDTNSRVEVLEEDRDRKSWARRLIARPVFYVLSTVVAGVVGAVINHFAG
jgi:hypothetical protein